ncbi:hypothetical protein Tco_0033439 [Tanacetum coccineum]
MNPFIAYRAKKVVRNQTISFSHSFKCSIFTSHVSPLILNSLTTILSHSSFSSDIDYEGRLQSEKQGDSQDDKPYNMQDELSSDTLWVRVDKQAEECGYTGKAHYACDCPQPKVCDAKYFKELMLLAMKDEAGGNLNEEENDFMLENHYGDDSLEELNAVVIMMARIQPTDDK